MSGQPTITDWISAISTAVLGILGVGFGIWQWMMTKFRPRLTARIDEEHAALELVIINKGRTSGVIDQVDVQAPDGALLDAVEFDGLPRGRFASQTLPAMASMRLIVRAAAGTTFPAECRVVVDLGRERAVVVTPGRAPPNTSLFALHSVLPPRG